MANQQDFDINISHIAAGMRQMNEMKLEMNIALRIITPCLGDMAHFATIGSCARFKDEKEIVFRIGDGVTGCTLLMEASEWNNHTSFFIEFLHEGSGTEILNGGRSSVGEITSSAKAQQLAKESVANCHALVQRLVMHIRDLYPEKLRAAVEPYTSLVR